MPGKDHTGPAGQGPRTGKQQGTCRSANSECNIVNQKQARRHRFGQTDTPGFQQRRAYGQGKNQLN